MERMLGIDRVAVLGHKQMHDFFSPEAYRRFRHDLVASGYGGKGRLMLYETRLLDHQDLPVPVQLSASTLMADAQPAGLVCFLKDLRRIHRLEQEMADQARLLHQDKMMSLGRLAASVAHEINNPLSGVLNYIRLMQRTLDKGPLTADRQPRFAGYLDLVETEIDRCATIVSSLLTFSRRSPVAMGPVSLNAIIDRSIVLARHKLELTNVSLDARVPEALPHVSGDANQLQQCILNLVFNAVDAMPDGGTLSLAAAFEATSGSIVLSVSDTGAGIGREAMAHIFEPFYTTKHEGHGIGLGLSTTYGIIERHGGSLSAHSQPGQGATFEIRLPIADPRTEGKEEAP
jgi:signal transduction histidine kinase